MNTDPEAQMFRSISNHTVLALQLLVLLLTAVSGCSDSPGNANAAEDANQAGDDQRATTLKAQIKSIEKLHEKLGKPQPGDWLAKHNEKGQSFELYLHSKPVRPIGERKILYIQPLGDFTKTQTKIVDITAEFIALYFGAAVKVKPSIPLATIPEKARRVHPQWGDKQILSTYVLDEFLKPRLPDDAACYLAFTAQDLWPGKGWNFVFGQASLRNRVGVWSIYRNGNADGSKEEYQRCLLRTLKTAVHETGHMFSIWHCTAYECNMCGSNSKRESDRRDIWICPQCVAKVCWASRIDMLKRYRGLEVFYKKYDFEKEAKFMHTSIEALNGAKPSKKN